MGYGSDTVNPGWPKDMLRVQVQNGSGRDKVGLGCTAAQLDVWAVATPMDSFLTRLSEYNIFDI